MYTKVDFGKGLEEKLKTTTDIVELSRWAHHVYLENCKDFEDGLVEIVMQVVAMEEGPEFEFSIPELCILKGTEGLFIVQFAKRGRSPIPGTVYLIHSIKFNGFLDIVDIAGAKDGKDA